MTRAVVLDRQGPAEVLRMDGRDLPGPGAGEVLVRVAAAGVNVVDLYQRSGAYRVGLPCVPGFEGSGTVLAVGDAVDGVAVGDRVAWMGVPGAYAERCLVPASRLVPVPAGMSLVDAAACLVQGMTAHMLVNDAAPPVRGAYCLVLGAAGGIGRLLCQLAAGCGATVIGAVGDLAKAAVVRSAGATHVVSYADGTFADEVRAISGAGADVVYDGIGSTLAEGLRSLRRRGRYVLYGQSGGAPGPIDPQALKNAGSVSLTTVSLAHYDDTEERMRDRAALVLRLVAAGAMQVRIHATLGLERAADAHRLLESRTATGKVLLIP